MLDCFFLTWHNFPDNEIINEAYRMYGIVNKAVEELVTSNYGLEKWAAIKKRSGVAVDFFISNEAYNDDVMYALAGAASAELDIPISDVMHALGEWWILKTGKEKYGSLLTAGGKNLKAFLLHLPVFHNRISLIYPKLTPPEFKISHVEENGLHLHYYSKRQGLKEFVRGLLYGLATLYNTPVTVKEINDQTGTGSQAVFSITW